VVNRGFLQGTQIMLGTRARGYASDRAVWQAIADHPGLAVIDSQAVLSRDGYAAQPLVNGAPAFTLSGVAQEDKVMDPTPVWIAALDGGRATRVTIIGVIDSRAYQTYGLFVNEATLAAAGAPAVAPSNYYFRTKAGLDQEREKRRLEAAFLDHGLEATVTGDEILRNQGPRMLISGMLEGFVGLTLCMGVVALGLVAARSVVERRQQIGMLRALGYPRHTVGASLLLEASFVAVLGSAAGVALGLALCRNLFSSNFFEQYKTGMLFVVPWDQLAVIVLIAYGASLLTTLAPAWQAARIVPAEALRYE
jgi:putative ABC transport system permease protein